MSDLPIGLPVVVSSEFRAHLALIANKVQPNRLGRRTFAEDYSFPCLFQSRKPCGGSALALYRSLIAWRFKLRLVC